MLDFVDIINYLNSCLYGNFDFLLSETQIFSYSLGPVKNRFGVDLLLEWQIQWKKLHYNNSLDLLYTFYGLNFFQKIPYSFKNCYSIKVLIQNPIFLKKNLFSEGFRFEDSLYVMEYMNLNGSQKRTFFQMLDQFFGKRSVYKYGVFKTDLNWIKQSLYLNNKVYPVSPMSDYFTNLWVYLRPDNVNVMKMSDAGFKEIGYFARDHVLRYLHHVFDLHQLPVSDLGRKDVRYFLQKESFRLDDYIFHVMDFSVLGDMSKRFRMLEQEILKWMVYKMPPLEYSFRSLEHFGYVPGGLTKTDGGLKFQLVNGILVENFPKDISYNILAQKGMLYRFFKFFIPEYLKNLEILNNVASYYEMQESKGFTLGLNRYYRTLGKAVASTISIPGINEDTNVLPVLLDLKKALLLDVYDLEANNFYNNYKQHVRIWIDYETIYEKYKEQILDKYFSSTYHGTVENLFEDRDYSFSLSKVYDDKFFFFNYFRIPTEFTIGEFIFDKEIILEPFINGYMQLYQNGYPAFLNRESLEPYYQVDILENGGMYFFDKLENEFVYYTEYNYSEPQNISPFSYNNILAIDNEYYYYNLVNFFRESLPFTVKSYFSDVLSHGEEGYELLYFDEIFKLEGQVYITKWKQNEQLSLDLSSVFEYYPRQQPFYMMPLARDVGFTTEFFEYDRQVHRLIREMGWDDPRFFIRQDISSARGAFLHFVEKEYENSFVVLSISNFSLHANDLVYVVFQLADLEFFTTNPNFADFLSERMDLDELPEEYESYDWDCWEKDLLMEEEIDFLDTEESFFEQVKVNIENSLDYVLESDLNENLDYFQVSQPINSRGNLFLEQSDIFENLNLTDDFVKEYLLERMDVEEWIDLMMTVFEFEEQWMFDYLKMEEDEKLGLINDIESVEKTIFSEVSTDESEFFEVGLGFVEFSDSYVSDTEVTSDFLEFQNVSDHFESDVSSNEDLDSMSVASSLFHFNEPPKTPSDVDSDDFRYVKIDNEEIDLIYGMVSDNEEIDLIYERVSDNEEDYDSEFVDYVNVLQNSDLNLEAIYSSIMGYHEYDLDDFWILYSEDLYYEHLLDLDIDILQGDLFGFEFDPSNRDLAQRQVSFHVYNEMKELGDYFISVEKFPEEDMILSVFVECLDIFAVFQNMIEDSSDLGLALFENISYEDIFEGLLIWFGDDMVNLSLKSNEVIVEEYISFSEDIKNRQELDLFLENLDTYFSQFFANPINKEFMLMEPVFEQNVLDKHFFDLIDDVVLWFLDNDFYNDFFDQDFKFEYLDLDTFFELSLYARTFEEWMLFYNDYELFFKIDNNLSILELTIKVEAEREEETSFFQTSIISSKLESLEKESSHFKEGFEVLDSQDSRPGIFDEEIFFFDQTFGYMSLFLEDFYGNLTTDNIFRLYVYDYSYNLELGIFMDLFTDDFRLILEDEGLLIKEFVNIGFEVFLDRKAKSSLALMAIYHQLIFLDNLIYYEKILNSKLSDYFFSLYFLEHKREFLVLNDSYSRIFLFDLLAKSFFNQFDFQDQFHMQEFSLSDFYLFINQNLKGDGEDSFILWLPLVVDKGNIELFKDTFKFNSIVYISSEVLDDVPTLLYQCLVMGGRTSNLRAYFLNDFDVSLFNVLDEFRLKIFLKENKNLNYLSQFGVSFLKYFLEYFHNYDFLKNHNYENLYFFTIEMMVFDQIFIFLNVEDEIFFSMKNRLRPLLHSIEFLDENLVFEKQLFSYTYVFPSVYSIISSAKDFKSLNSFTQLIYDFAENSEDFGLVLLQLEDIKRVILDEISILDSQSIEIIKEVHTEEAEVVKEVHVEDEEVISLIEGESLIIDNTSNKIFKKSKLLKTVRFDPVSGGMKVSEVVSSKEVLEAEPLNEDEKNKMIMTFEQMREESKHRNLNKLEIVEGKFIINDNNVNDNNIIEVEGFERSLEEIDSFTYESYNLKKAIALSMEEEKLKISSSSGKEEVLEETEPDVFLKSSSKHNKEIEDNEIINLSLKTYREEEEQRMLEEEQLKKVLAESKVTAFEDDKRRALEEEEEIHVATDMEGTLETDRAIRERDKRQMERELYEGRMVASALSESIREYEMMISKQRGKEVNDYFLNLEFMKRNSEIQTIVQRYMEKKSIYFEKSIVFRGSFYSNEGYLFVSKSFKSNFVIVSLNLYVKDYLNSFFYNEGLIYLLEEYKFKNKSNDYIAFAVGEMFLQEYMISWNKYLQNLTVRPNILLAEKRAQLFLEEIFYYRNLLLDFENEYLEQGLDFSMIGELEEGVLSYIHNKAQFRGIIANSFSYYKNVWYQRYVIEGPVWWDLSFEVTDLTLGFDKILFKEDLISAQRELLQPRTTRFIRREIIRPFGYRNVYIGNSFFFNRSLIPLEQWVGDNSIVNHILDQSDLLFGFRQVSYEQKLILKRQILSLLNIRFRMSDDLIHYSIGELMDLLIKRLSLSKLSLLERHFEKDLLMKWYYNTFLILDQVNFKFYNRFLDEIINTNSGLGYEDFVCFYWHTLEKTVRHFESKKNYLENNFLVEDFEFLNVLVQRILIEEEDYIGVFGNLSSEGTISDESSQKLQSSVGEEKSIEEEDSIGEENFEDEVINKKEEEYDFD